MNQRHGSATTIKGLIGAVAVAMALILAACGGGGSGAQRAGEQIKIGSMFPPGTLDPTLGTQGSDLAYLDFVFDRLIDVDPDTGELVPMLATSWKFVGKDKLTLKVTLRHGVKFQDGTPFDAKAVVAHAKRYIKAGDIANLLENVDDVTAVGKYEVDYHLSKPNARLPYGLAARAGMIPSPTAVKKYGKKFATHPVGAGPYSFDSSVQNASYTFKRFDGYWNDAKTPRERSVKFVIFQSDTALVNAIQSKDVDAALHLLPQDVKNLKSDTSLQVTVQPGPAIGIAYLNASRKPLDRPEVRLAINLALDRKVIARTVTEGLGTAVTQPLPKGAHGYEADMDPLWKQSVPKAKKLMKKAGYGDGVKLTCYEYKGLGFETAGPILISQLKKIGIDLKILPATPAQVGPFFTNKTSEQCAFANWSATDPFKGYQLLWSKSYYNAGKVDFGIDRAYQKFYDTYDRKSEDRIVRTILRSQRKNPGYVPIFRSPVVDAYDSGLSGWRKSRLGLTNWRSLHWTDK